ncbi:MAG: hypothetical protein IPP90_07520 [Gemmatimonadaceae bacterium]|nr:hypothetical protein [Gemmatimonadaceae bacterium]
MVSPTNDVSTRRLGEILEMLVSPSFVMSVTAQLESSQDATSRLTRYKAGTLLARLRVGWIIGRGAEVGAGRS